MKKNKSLLSILLLSILLLSISLVSANLGTFKQGDCIDIRVLANCTEINLTEVNDGIQTFIINSPMTNLGGQTFNYSFCSTSNIGIYTYSWNNPCADCSQDNCGNNFEITPNGLLKNIGFYILVLILTLGIVVIGYLVEDYWILILGAFGLILFGLYILFFGIVGMKDVAYTWGIGIIIIMLGAYLMIRAGLEQINY